MPEPREYWVTITRWLQVEETLEVVVSAESEDGARDRAHDLSVLGTRNGWRERAFTVTDADVEIEALNA